MDVDTAVIQRHRRCAPDYDIYPASEWFVEAFDGAALDAAFAATRGVTVPHVALDLHLPAATPDWPLSARRAFPDLLERELALCATRLSLARLPIDELNVRWQDMGERNMSRTGPGAGISGISGISGIRGIGGMSSVSGTSGAKGSGGHTHAGLEPAQLMALLSRHVEVSTAAHRSVVVPVRSRRLAAIQTLRSLGFSRIDIVDDLAPSAGWPGGSGWPGTTGWPPRRATAAAATLPMCQWIHAAAEMGFSSIGATLVYGAPGQSPGQVREALDSLLTAGPTHITLRHANDCQRGFRPVLDRLRGDRVPLDTLRLLGHLVQQLADAGYGCIGQDRYAMTGDPLAIAHRQGRLSRMAHGASLRPVSMVLGVGPGAIGTVGNAYYQHHAGAHAYGAALAEDRLPVARGTLLGALDLARRSVIQALTTHLFVDMSAIESAHGLDFRRHFADEMLELKELESAGLLLIDDNAIDLTVAGRLIASSVAMVFDQRLREARNRVPFSGLL